MQFGDTFAELRRDKGLKQCELGEILHISPQVISSYERNIRQPSIEMLIEFARFFNVSVDYLLGLTDLPISPSVLETEFTDGVTYSSILNILPRLNPEQRSALLTILDNMQFYTEITEQTKHFEAAQKTARKGVHKK